MTRKAHHAGTYQTTRNAVVAAANANPNAVCWRDGLTLTQHPATTKTGKPNTWTGGHTIDGYRNAPGWYDVTRPPPPGPWIAPEPATCNYAGGATRVNTPNPQSRRWLA